MTIQFINEWQQPSRRVRFYWPWGKPDERFKRMLEEVLKE